MTENDFGMIITGSPDEELYSKSERADYLWVIANKMEETDPIKIAEQLTD